MRALVLLLTLSSGLSLAQTDPDPWLGPDKALHFGVSAGIAAAGYGGAALFTEQRGVRVLVGAGLGLAAGIGKELLDLAGLGDPSWKDFAWDVAGTAFGVLVSWLLDVFVFTPLSQPAPRPAGASP